MFMRQARRKGWISVTRRARNGAPSRYSRSVRVWLVRSTFTSRTEGPVRAESPVQARNSAENSKNEPTSAVTKKTSSLATAYLDLAKAKLSALVVTTTAAGFVAAGGPIATQWPVLASCLIGTALCSSSAAAWNQILELPNDQRMKRTQQRPLVTGALTVNQALPAAILWGAAGTSILAVGTDVVTASLGVGNMILYAGVYTSLKPRTVYNTWVGAAVGAIPPIMGWSAATGGCACDIEALLLGTTLYLWQMPHFFALSFMHRADYKRGGFQMIPCLEDDGVETAGVIVRYAWYLATVPLVATALNLTSSMFALESVLLNGYAIRVAHQFSQERTNARARKVFLTSLWYLPCWLMLYLLHSKTWDQDTQEDFVRQWLQERIMRIRNAGKELCLHEQQAAKTTSDAACPVTVTQKRTRETVEAAVAATEQGVNQTKGEAKDV